MHSLPEFKDLFSMTCTDVVGVTPLVQLGQFLEYP